MSGGAYVSGIPYKRGTAYVAVFLCGLFGLGIIGFGERSEVEESGTGEFYRGEFLPTDQPHNGQDRGDESDLIYVGSPTMYANTLSVVTYSPGSLTPFADHYGNKVYWLPR